MAVFLLHEHHCRRVALIAGPFGVRRVVLTVVVYFVTLRLAPSAVLALLVWSMLALLSHLFYEGIKRNKLKVLIEGLFFGRFRLWLIFLRFRLSCAWSFSSRVNHHGVVLRILRGRHGLFSSNSCDGDIFVADVKAATMLQAELSKNLLILPLQLHLHFVISKQDNCLRIDGKSFMQLQKIKLSKVILPVWVLQKWWWFSFPIGICLRHWTPR